MTAGLDPGAGDAAGAGEGSAEDFSGVPLLAMAATTSFGLGVIRCSLERHHARASAGLSPCSRQRATADTKEPWVRRVIRWQLTGSQPSSTTSSAWTTGMQMADPVNPAPAAQRRVLLHCLRFGDRGPALPKDVSNLCATLSAPHPYPAPYSARKAKWTWRMRRPACGPRRSVSYGAESLARVDMAVAYLLTRRLDGAADSLAPVLAIPADQRGDRDEHPDRGRPVCQRPARSASRAGGEFRHTARGGRHRAGPGPAPEPQAFPLDQVLDALG